jgi:hypothetical protein
MGSGPKTGRRIFYLKVEKVEEGNRKRGLLKTYSTSLTSRLLKFFMYRSCSKTSVLEQAHPLLQSCTNTRSIRDYTVKEEMYYGK